jgi:hypothetical protein
MTDMILMINPKNKRERADETMRDLFGNLTSTSSVTKINSSEHLENHKRTFRESQRASMKLLSMLDAVWL